jgi:zinc protease
VIGFKEVVSGFTRENVLQFRKKWYVPENMFFVIVGDVDAQQVRSELEKLTADIKPTGFFSPPRPVEPKQDKVRSALVRNRNTREARLYMAFHIPSISGNDVNALDLTADILGSRQSSRLVKVIKKDKGLVNSINAYAMTPKKSGLFLISATMEAKNLKAATKAIIEELDKLRKEAPPSEELERAKVNIESYTLYSRETVQGVARGIGNFEADLGDAAYEQKYLKLNRSVKAEDISRVVREYLSPPNITLTVLVPEKDAPDLSMEKLAAIVEVPVATEQEKARLASHTEVLTQTLPNGMRVVLRRDTSNPLISLRIACLGGKRFEGKNDEGIMNFVAQMLSKGAGKMTEVEISRKIEDMGGRLSGSSGYDSFGLAVSFFSRHMADGLNLLAKLYTDPSFPQDKVERQRELIINSIRTAPDRPIPFAIKNFNRVMFPDHPYGFDKEGTIATVSSFARDDLVKTYKRFAVPSNTVITGVGDMDLDKAMGIIVDLFGKIPGKALNVPDIPKEARLKDRIEEIVRLPRAKSHIVIGFRGVALSSPDRYPLEVLSNILAGQGGRLFLELRDKESLAYTVTAFLRPGMDPGIFAFYMACDVPKTQRALKGLFEQIDLVRNTKVGQEELDRAKNNLLGNHKIALQSSWARAENTALNTLYGLGYDFDPEFVKKISEVTSEDVIRVAKKYLDPGKSVTVKILPEEDKKKEGP